jgi:hypothetical protein
MATTTSSTTVSPQERQRLLHEAAHKYMRGDIDQKKYREIERRYRPNYRAAISALVKTRDRKARKGKKS